jgi:hypothetical protein
MALLIACARVHFQMIFEQNFLFINFVAAFDCTAEGRLRVDDFVTKKLLFCAKQFATNFARHFANIGKMRLFAGR